MLSANRYFVLKSLSEEEGRASAVVMRHELEDLLDAYRQVWGEPRDEQVESD